MSLIETRAVTRVYQMGSNQVKALDDVSVGVAEGEFGRVAVDIRIGLDAVDDG